MADAGLTGESEEGGYEGVLGLRQPALQGSGWWAGLV